MHDLPTTEAVRALLNQPLDTRLERLLADRLADTIHCGLQAYTHILVVETGDTEQQIIDAVGFSPLRSRIDQRPNQPDWDWIERHDGWWELLYTVGNDGFAFILLVEDCDGFSLAEICRQGARL